MFSMDVLNNIDNFISLQHILEGNNLNPRPSTFCCSKPASEHSSSNPARGNRVQNEVNEINNPHSHSTSTGPRPTSSFNKGADIDHLALIEEKSVEIKPRQHIRVGVCYTCDTNGKTGCLDVIHTMSIFPELAEFSELILTILQCSECKKDSAVWIDSKWELIENVLHTNKCENIVFSQVDDCVQRLLLFILSQILYNNHDIENDQSPFLPPPPSEFARLLWYQGQTVGFYTVKTKGSPFSDVPMCVYALDIVDTIYVRKSFRHKGLAMLMLKDLLQQFPTGDIGFSHPLSEAMLSVLKKHLLSNPSHRDLLWECSYTGEECYRRNIWLHLKSLHIRKRLTHD